MITPAQVAELADALGSGPSGILFPVEVRVLSWAYLQLVHSHNQPQTPEKQEFLHSLFHWLAVQCDPLLAYTAPLLLTQNELPLLVGNASPQWPYCCQSIDKLACIGNVSANSVSRVARKL